MTPDSHSPIAAWQLWANPIIRRYARARLRPGALGAWLLITVVIAGFFFFIFRVTSMGRGQMLEVDAERMPFTSLLVIQALILFFLGTGQVAGGITGEADEGVLDYQQLTPMTPLAKVVGFWFGLPIREWVMFVATLPFTAWCIWRGQIPFGAWASVYTVLITSALLYHLTGLTVGSVVKNRRWAFLSSMGIIVLLYTLLPQVSRFGLLFFDYITIWPVIEERMPEFLPRNVGRVAKLANELWPSVKFFNLALPQLAFTLFCQGGLMLTLITMVWRRWRRVESHLLSKVWALGLIIWLQVLMLGNGLPIIETGKVFPSREFSGQFGLKRDWQPDLGEGLAIIGVYSFVTLIIILVLTNLITPNEERHVRGLRSARKLGHARVPLVSDAASAWRFVLVMTLIGSVGVYTFGHHMLASDWFAGQAWSVWVMGVIALSLLNATLSFHAVKEAWGVRSLFLSLLLAGFLPVMIAAIVGSASDALLPLTTWLALMSPFAGPAVAPVVITPDAVMPDQIARALPRAFWFWQAVLLAVNLWLHVKWRAVLKARRASVEAEPT